MVGRVLREGMREIGKGKNKGEMDRGGNGERKEEMGRGCLLYTSPSPRDRQKSRMPSSA